VGVPIEPRSQWPTGAGRLGVEADGKPIAGKIAADERHETGRVVARLTDLGWGGVLRELFAAGASDAAVSDDLLGGCVRVLRDWDWAERPIGVVAVASVTRPRLVRSVAEGIARLGRLPLLGQLDLADAAPAETAGGNSAYRLAGVWGRFQVGPQLADALSQASGPVLLVDDLVDSRWTLTVAARELRRHGADSVLPFALGAVA
jgi:ATP-dependent DNA helicase RecQ